MVYCHNVRHHQPDRSTRRVWVHYRPEASTHRMRRARGHYTFAGQGENYHGFCQSMLLLTINWR